MADSFYSGQVVDTPTAHEFTEKALERITREELGDVAALLEAKAAAFRRTLAPAALAELSDEAALAVLRSVFASRRRAGVILGTLGTERFAALVDALLWGEGPPGERLARFHDVIAGLGRDVHPSVGFDLGSELLHFTAPDAHWLWTRWMWDPDSEVGALPLIITEEVDLAGGGVAETYRRVGVAVAFVTHVGEAAGFHGSGGHGPFDTDVYLACVYAIYIYTTLRMRMTQEFNQVVPNLGDLLRRLLGVHRSPLLTGVAA